MVNGALGLPPWTPPTQGDAAPTLPGELVALEAISSRLAALIEMSLELAAERNPEQLLQGFGDMARKLLASKYATVGILGEDGLPLRQMGIMQERTPGQARIMAGAKCPECANTTLIRKDGCDYCTACGFTGVCG